MYEPDLDNVTLVRETMRHACLVGITLREVAASDMSGARRFACDDVSGLTGGIQDGGPSFSERQWHVAGRTVIVDTVSLDEERVHTQAPDLIKIDVEGHEERVIRGSLETIRRDQPILIFECFHGGADIRDALERLGYWIGDAERMSDNLARASNFLALPRRHRARFGELQKQWTDEMARFAR